MAICRSFSKDLYPENFDACSLVIPTTRASACPGNGAIIPSQVWGTGEEGVINFLNDDAGGKPPLFETTANNTFKFVVSI